MRKGHPRGKPHGPTKSLSVDQRLIAKVQSPAHEDVPKKRLNASSMLSSCTSQMLTSVIGSKSECPEPLLPVSIHFANLC